MDLSARVLGRSVVSYLTDRQKSAILTIGSDRFDRASLAGVSCFHFLAAANLSKLLTTELRVANTRDLFDSIDPMRLAIPRLGAVSIAVLGAAFEAKGIGGKSPLEAWFAKHRDSTVSFAMLKHTDPKQPDTQEKKSDGKHPDRPKARQSARVPRKRGSGDPRHTRASVRHAAARA